MDPIFFVLVILRILIPVALIGLIVYGIVVWRRRSSELSQEDNTDTGIGTVRRLYFYVVAFVSLMMSASGLVMLIEFILDGIAGGAVLSGSNTGLAAGASLLIVGAPLWFFHWRYIRRVVAAQPAETRSVLRKLYIYITIAVASSFVIYTAFDLLNWIFRTEDFSGYSLAAIIIWGAVRVYHWRIEEREGQPTPDTRAIRRLYIYLASLVGLVMLSIGVGRVFYFILLEGYNALASVSHLGSEPGLWRHALREMLALAIVGGATWALHWLYIARRDFDSRLRQVYLYIFAILGGVITTLTALGIIIHETLVWALDNYDAASAAEHFDFLPWSIAALAVGAALWAYHWHRVRLEAGMSAGTTLSARRAYTYILTAIGTGTLAAAIFMLGTSGVKIVLASFGDVIVGADQWKGPLANIITLTVMGAPLWGYYWRNIERRTLDIGADERQATSRRLFLFAALGIGVLALLGSVSTMLFMFLRDLLDASLSLGTLDDVTAPIAIIAAAAAFLPYYWAVYRDDQDAIPEPEPALSTDVPSVRPESVEGTGPDRIGGQSPGKSVTLLAADGGILAQQIRNALGYDIETLRWADADAAMPALTDADCAQLAQAIADAPGRHVLLIPDGRTVRVLSHN